MSIVQSIQRNTATLTAGLSFIDITLGIPLTDLSRDLISAKRDVESGSHSLRIFQIINSKWDP